MNIQELPKTIQGNGEVKGITFNEVYSTAKGRVFEASGCGSTYYEAFERKTVPTCIDFAKRIYSETEAKEVYPKSKDFGVWAITTKDKQRAINFVNQLN